MARFFPDFQISKVHGQAFRKQFLNKSQVFLFLYHPAAALYNGGMREKVKKDFKIIPKLLEKINDIQTDKLIAEKDLNNINLLDKETLHQEELFLT